MQTETIFRAARALEVIGQTIRDTDPSLQFSFHGRAGELTVILTGRPEHELCAIAEDISEAGMKLGRDDAFSIHPVMGNSTGWQFRVEAE